MGLAEKYVSKAHCTAEIHEEKASGGADASCSADGFCTQGVDRTQGVAKA